MRRPVLTTFISLAAALGGAVSSSLPLCAQPGRDGPTYSANSYYPGSASASAAGTTLTLGSLRTGGGAASTPIAAGDLLFIIQMQDADINPAGGNLTNTNATTYGDGASGRGFTALNDAGHYEFAVVRSVAGNVVTLRDPLQYSYLAAPATASSGRHTFQVLRVPQHAALTLTAPVTAPAWDGQSGGVVVLDVAGTLNLNGQTIDASASGYRGGGAFTNGSLTGQAVSDYANVYATPNARGAMKGEGYAGTPSLVRGTTVTGGVSGTAANLPTGDLGYPNGYVVARGAPGNAGGGGDQHNGGGGGGGNVGAGGKGGYSFGTYSTTKTNAACLTLTSGSTTYYACNGDGSRDVGGLGGASVTTDATRLFPGGGGGAGDTNNASDTPGTAQSSGGAGGGIIFIRAGGVSGTGTLKANGQDGQSAGRDGAGGGGAGGTVALDVPGAALSGVSVQVRGGAGGNSGLPLRGNETQGSGGGGGGGALLLAPGVSVGSVDVGGGTPGVNSPASGVSNTYGSVAGGGGTGTLNYANANAPLPDLCVPQLTVTKSTATPTRFTNSARATYTITVRNAAGRSDAQNVTVTDPTLPGAFTLAGTSAVTLSGAATRATVSDPPAGTTAPSWASFTVPGGGAVSVTFDVALNSPATGTYQNAAQASYLDPVRTTAAGTARASYDPAASAAEDVTVYAPPRIVLEKWVRNVSRREGFGTNGVGLPGEVLEYCINYRNVGGYVAADFTLSDAPPLNTDVRLDAYGPGLGVRAAAGAQVDAGAAQPTGLNLTNEVDADAASLSAPAGLQYSLSLGAGAQGVACFQVSIR